MRLGFEGTLRLQIGLAGYPEEVATGAFMANTFYDFDTGTNRIPTPGGGLGLLVGPRGSAFSYQGGGGTGYRYSDEFGILALEYRFLRAKSSSLDASTAPSCLLADKYSDATRGGVAAVAKIVQRLRCKLTKNLTESC